MLSVARTPGAFGLHLYQTPSKRALFQTKSIECICGPGVSSMGQLSLATSSIFPLPDVSEKIFSCGLASFRVPVQNVCTDSSLTNVGITRTTIKDVLVAISLTNKGDIYAHTLLTSMADQKYGKVFDGLPLGYTAIPAPVQSSNVNNQCWNALAMTLCNDFPIPGSALRPPERKRKTLHTSTIDLSSIIEKEDRSKIQQDHLRSNALVVRSAVQDPTDISRPSVSSTHEDFVSLHVDGKKCKFKSSLEPEQLTRIDVPTEDLPCRMRVTSDTSLEEVAKSLSLPAHLMLQSDDELPIEHFLKLERLANEGESEEGKVWRSDLTPSMLNHAWDENWDDQSD
jgi:hypothetical protein